MMGIGSTGILLFAIFVRLRYGTLAKPRGTALSGAS
jgi:hypothetical protein